MKKLFIIFLLLPVFAVAETVCNFDYLKPISYDDLFDDKSKNKCNDYQLILDKLTEARNAFFGFQASLYNFIIICHPVGQRFRLHTDQSILL